MAPIPHFTGKERDAESGLDYFFARYYSSDLARFMTPDWAAAPTAVPYATFGDPQSLNLYAYVNNNPNTGIDMDGHVDSSDSSMPDADGARPGVDANFLMAGYSGDAVDSQYGPSLNYQGEGGTDTTNPSGATSGSGQNTGSNTPGTPAQPAPQNPTPKKPDENQKATVTCTGTARVLKGNTALEGHAGGIPGQTVKAGSAAVIPSQFGVKSGTALASAAGTIHGTVGGVPFHGVTDVMGGKSPIPGENVRTAMQQLNPGRLVLEIPGGSDLGVVRVTITVPTNLGCPQGTKPE